MHFIPAVLFALSISMNGSGQECTLAGYLEKGVAASPELKDLSNRILANRYDSLITRAASLPQVGFNAYMMYAPTVNGWGYSDVITNGQNLAGTVNVNQQLFNRKNLAANDEKYGLEAGSLSNARDLGVNELKRAITAQYLTACAALEEKKFQQDLLAALTREAVILKSWTENGIYRQTDYLAFRVEIMSLEQHIRDLDLHYRKEFWNLNQICGIGDTSVCDLAMPSLGETGPVVPGQSVFLRRFEIDSLKSLNEKLLIDRGYKPSFSWFADGGLVNNEPQYIYRNFGISLGMSMTLPMYDGGRRKLGYEKIRTQEETRAQYEEVFRLTNRTRLDALRSELKSTMLLAEENGKQLSLAEELIAADRALLNTGSLPVTDYILALKNLVETRHSGLLYQIRIQFIRNEINYWMQ